MSKTLKVTALFVFLASALGCAVSGNRHVQEQACTDEWYSSVEKQLSTGDGQGHGPDLGSNEWRSVVEFKLGIRGNPDIPPKHKDEWCDYINQNYIE